MEQDMVAINEVRYDLAMARDPNQVLAEAMTAAKAMQSVIKQKSKPVIFGGEQYVEFEDWQVLGRFYGVTAKIVSTEYIDINGTKGFVARAEAIDATGRVVSAAEAMCLNDEDKWSTRTKYEWKDGKKEKVGEVAVPLFQLRSMAQTRACAKALRNILAWVVVMAGFRPSVAEEMTGDEHAPAREPIKQPQPKSEPSDDIATFTPVSVEVRHGEKDGKSWTKYGINSPDGKTYGTFDENYGNMAQDAAKSGAKITVGYKLDKTGKYLNVIKVFPVKSDPGCAQE